MEQHKTELSPGIKRQAKLPLFLGAKAVEDMAIGESRAVQTHAMIVDANYDLWVVGAWKTYSNPSEDHPLIITRTDNGYDVDATLVEDDGWFVDKELTEHEETEGRRLFPIFGIKFDIPKG